MPPKNKNVKPAAIKAKPNKVTKVKIIKPPVKVSSGEKIGRSLGGFLGKAAENVIGSIFGMGDYTVKYNSLTGAGGPPQFSDKGSMRSTVITHREFVKDITGSTAFTLQSFSITPSNNVLFPWLAQIASNYEEYRIHGMIMEYKTTSGVSVGSTNTALGTVIQATQYNPNDTPFVGKIDMENYEFATSGGPFENFLHPIECKPSLTVAPQLYVQQPVNPGSVVDLRLTNFGTYNIATVGMQAANVIGELWVSYQVELLKPRVSANFIGSGSSTFTNNTGLTSSTSTNSLGSVVPTVNLSLPNTDGASTFGNMLFSTTALSTYVTSLNQPNTPVLTYGGVAGGIYFPAALFGGRIILFTVSYIGTVVTSAPGISGTNTFGISSSTGYTAPSGFTSTSSTYTAAYYINTQAQNAVGQYGSYVTFTTPAATTLTNVVLSMTLLN